MDKEQFCDDFCPVPFRGVCRDGSVEVDCDCEESECPFTGANFAKIDRLEDVSQ